MRISDWSSDVCSSDLARKTPGKRRISAARRGQGASGPASNLQNQYRQSSGSIVRTNPRPEYSDPSTPSLCWSELSSSILSIVNTECHVPHTFSDFAKLAAWDRPGLDNPGSPFLSPARGAGQ